MGFEAISSTRMIALMIAGGLFACVGLYMMLRPRPEGAAKVELFGLKFESSSAGLLVFLVGAAFLAVTLFVPEKSSEARTTQPVTSPVAPVQPAPAPSGPVASSSASAVPGTGAGGDSAAAGSVVQEQEPNQIARDANVLALAGIGTGKVGSKNRDEDWWVVTLPTTDLRTYEVKLSHVAGSTIQAFVFDTRERELGMVSTSQGSKYLQFEDGASDKLFIKVRGGMSFDRHYEVSVLQRASQ